MVTWCIAKMASVMRFSAQKGVILSLKSGRKCCKSERLDGFLVILCTKWSQMGVPRTWGTWSALSCHWFPMKNGRSSMMIDLDKWKHPSILIIVGYIYHYTFYIPIISTSLEKKKPCYLLYRPFLMLNQADHIPFFFPFSLPHLLVSHDFSTASPIESTEPTGSADCVRRLIQARAEINAAWDPENFVSGRAGTMEADRSMEISTFCWNPWENEISHQFQDFQGKMLDVVPLI